MTEQEQVAHLHVALGTIEAAFQALSNAVQRPLESLARYHWNKACQTHNVPEGKIILITEDELCADTYGRLYFVHTDNRMELSDLERENNADTEDNIRDKWLESHATLMTRVVADPVSVSVEVPLWTVGQPTAEKLGNNIGTAFDNIVGALSHAATSSGTFMLATRPTITISPTSDDPFQANIHVFCRTGQGWSTDQAAS